MLEGKLQGAGLSAIGQNVEVRTLTDISIGGD